MIQDEFKKWNGTEGIEKRKKNNGLVGLGKENEW